MAGERIQKISSPGMTVLVVVAAVAIIAFPNRALVVLAGAQLIVAGGCALQTGVAMRRQPPARPAAYVFALKAFFWAAMAAYLVWMNVQTPGTAGL